MGIYIVDDMGINIVDDTWVFILWMTRDDTWVFIYCG